MSTFLLVCACMFVFVNKKFCVVGIRIPRGTQLGAGVATAHCPRQVSKQQRSVLSITNVFCFFFQPIPIHCQYTQMLKKYAIEHRNVCFPRCDGMGCDVNIGEWEERTMWESVIHPILSFGQIMVAWSLFYTQVACCYCYLHKQNYYQTALLFRDSIFPPTDSCFVCSWWCCVDSFY